MLLYCYIYSNVLIFLKYTSIGLIHCSIDIDQHNIEINNTFKIVAMVIVATS